MTDAKPRRLRVSRKKGDKLPPGAAYVGRPTKWGNPWVVSADGGGEWVVTHRDDPTVWGLRRAEAQAVAVWRYEASLTPERRRELRGRDLACWCALGTPCHADALLRIANEEEGA